MKKITLLLICLFTAIIVEAQCTQTANSFGNNTVPGYDVRGNVDVVLNPNNTVTVNLGSNFSTAFGPDVRIFLVDRGSFTDNQLKSPSVFLSRPRMEIGLINNFNGASSYTAALPNNTTLADYQTIFFYCLQFNAFWDFGSFTPINSSNCTLSNESLEATQFSVFPNPAVDELVIESNTNDVITGVTIYSALGREVYSAKGRIEDRIDIQNLPEGAYFVRITNENNLVSTVKLLKRN